jgi:hypothetical protein
LGSPHNNELTINKWGAVLVVEEGMRLPLGTVERGGRAGMMRVPSTINVPKFLTAPWMPTTTPVLLIISRQPNHSHLPKRVDPKDDMWSQVEWALHLDCWPP